MAKAKAKKTKGKPRKRGFPWLWVSSVALVITAFIAVFLLISPSHDSINSQKLKAAIIDQLYTHHPGEDFTTKVTQELEGHGFEVDLYQGDEVTVDFYRNLPTYGYKLIVLRTHSGAMYPGSENVEIIQGIYLFTNELYTKTKYLKEQLNDELVPARIVEDSPDFFAIGPEFITNSMKGNFNSTVVIIDGCSCLYNNDLALAFVDKGASTYLAWDATVNLDYVDEATITLIENLCSQALPVKEAVDLTMATEGPDPEYYAVLKYYPPQSGSKTLKELI